ncbi:hypothetical protein CHUAL_007992 [Chamberlinius hualienensis]
MATTSKDDEITEPNTCQILIIGAGLAGLAAAKHLIEHGINDFKILEARNRIGGRVITIPIGSVPLELGAMWIHGILGNPIYEIALRNRLIRVNLERKSHNVMACTEQGYKVPFVILREVYNIYYLFLKRCEEYFLCSSIPPPRIRSAGEHLENDISKFLGGFPMDERPIRRMLFDHLLTRETCISGCNSMNDLDLADFGTYSELPGGNLQIDSGFASILDCILKYLPQDCIYKEHTVGKVQWQFRNSSPNKNTDSETPAKKVVVSCTNGKVFKADHVIVTIPLGVLKEKAEQLFEPLLPQYKLEAIKRLGFGTVNKIFLEYERPFLHPDISEVIILWDRSKKRENSPNSSSANNTFESTWYKKIYSFTKINDVLLLAWVSGAEAIYVETLSAENIADKCTEILRTFLKDPYVPSPKRVIRTRWHGEVNTRGSYTSIPVGSSQGDIDDLAKPIYSVPSDVKPVLLFAGEATHSTFYSTTHGALISGCNAAKILTEKEPSNGMASISDMGEISSWVQVHLVNCETGEIGALSGFSPEPAVSDTSASARTKIISVRTKGLSCIDEYNLPCIYASNQNSVLRLTLENLYHRKFWVAVTLQKPNQINAYDPFGAPLCDPGLFYDPKLLEVDALIFRTDVDMNFFLPNSTQGFSQLDYYFCLNASSHTGQWIHQGDVKLKIKSMSVTGSYIPAAVVTGVQPMGDSASIADNGYINIPADTDITLRLFGFNFSMTSSIRFTTQNASRWDRCDDFKSSKGFVIHTDELTDHSAKVTVSLPEMNSVDEVMYMCVKESDQNGEIVRWVHQGPENWLLIQTYGRLLPLWLQIIIIFTLLTLSGLFSGLNLGLMALDRTDLKIIENTGSEEERRYARVISPVRARGNYLLCTLLLGNVLVNSSLTILLDDLTSGIIAIIGSTLAIVIFGEIVPQAICSRHGLFVGAHTVWVTKFFMLVTFPLSFPISKILDVALGNEIGNFYNRDRLKELIRVTSHIHDLAKEEVNIISGALDINRKTVDEVMTKLDDVFMIPIDAVLDFETMSEIMKHGYSRIPVYEKDRSNILNILNIKDLAFVDPDDNTPVKTVCQFYNHPVTFLFTDSTLAHAFEMFKTGRSHISVVQLVQQETPSDPYYENVGVVTLEDIIEEIIQTEINDETDVISDNRRRLKRKDAQVRQDFSLFAQPDEIRVHITPQMMLATFQFLSTSLDPFKPELITPAVLKRLLKHDIYAQTKSKPESPTYLYECGKQADYFILILEGRVNVTIGKESLLFQCGPFAYFGAQILVQTIDDTVTPVGTLLNQLPTSASAPSSIPSISSPITQQPLPPSNQAVTPSQQPSAVNVSTASGIDQGGSKFFIPDYTVEAIEDVAYIRLKRSLYQASLKATLMERQNKLDPSEDPFKNIDKLQSDSMERLNSARSSMRSVENLEPWKNSIRSVVAPFATSPLNTSSPITINRHRAFSQPEVVSKIASIPEVIPKSLPPSYEKSFQDPVTSTTINTENNEKAKLESEAIEEEEEEMKNEKPTKIEIEPNDCAMVDMSPLAPEVGNSRKRFSNPVVWQRSEDSSSSPVRNGQPAVPPYLYESNL